MKTETFTKAVDLIDNINKLESELTRIDSMERNELGKVVPFFCGINNGGQTGYINISDAVVNEILSILRKDVACRLMKANTEFEQL